MQVLQDQSDVALELTGVLDINTADQVRRVLLESLEQQAALMIDLSQIVSCDAAGAQLLVATEKSAESAGKQFSIRAISEALVRDCADIGIQIASLTRSTGVQNLPRKDCETKTPRRTTKKPLKKGVVAHNA